MDAAFPLARAHRSLARGYSVRYDLLYLLYENSSKVHGPRRALVRSSAISSGRLVLVRPKWIDLHTEAPQQVQLDHVPSLYAGQDRRGHSRRRQMYVHVHP